MITISIALPLWRNDFLSFSEYRLARNLCLPYAQTSGKYINNPRLQNVQHNLAQDLMKKIHCRIQRRISQLNYSTFSKRTYIFAKETGPSCYFHFESSALHFFCIFSKVTFLNMSFLSKKYLNKDIIIKEEKKYIYIYTKREREKKREIIIN